MKKQLFLASALALVALTTATSCNQYAGEKYTPGEPLKVGLICLHDETSTYDANFISAFKSAFKNAQDAGYISKEDKVENSIKTGIPEGSECYKACQEFVNQKYNLIFTDSFGHDEFVHDAAKKFKNVQFSSATGIEARTSGLDNYHNAFASIYEGRYLAGVSAAYYLMENKSKTVDSDVHLGYVGAYPYAEVISGYTSWYLGVKSVLPKATMTVTYTNEWYSPEEEQKAAARLIKNGQIDCMSQHADSYGAPGECAKTENKIPNVSYNIPLDGDTYKDIYVGYSKINWQPYYDNVIKSMFEGKTQFDGEKEKNWTGDLSTKSVGFDFNETKIKEKEHVEAIRKVQHDLITHELHVFDTSKFSVNDLAQGKHDKDYEFGAPKKDVDYKIDEAGHLTMMKGATDMYDRDQDLIAKDDKATYINESYYRSAPSFDFIIDGITII